VYIVRMLSDPQVMFSNPSTAYFRIIDYWRSAHWRRFSSLPAVVHLASYPPGKANRVAAYQWYCSGVNTEEKTSFAYIHVVAFRSAIYIPKLTVLARNIIIKMSFKMMKNVLRNKIRSISFGTRIENGSRRPISHFSDGQHCFAGRFESPGEG